jgi:hypothetical protein
MKAKATMGTIGLRIDAKPRIAIRKALLAALKTNSISAVAAGMKWKRCGSVGANWAGSFMISA